MAKPPAGKEPGTRQYGGEELMLAERWVWGGDSKMSPRDRGVQEQSLDVRGGEEKERTERGSQKSWGLWATGPERKFPGQAAPEVVRALGAMSEHSRADTQPPGSHGAATPGSEPCESCFAYDLHTAHLVAGSRMEQGSLALCWELKPPLPCSVMLQASVSPSGMMTPALYIQSCKNQMLVSTWKAPSSTFLPANSSHPQVSA